MSFQQPNFLFLLALLPAIVLLYILRSQRVQARVTTLRFWRKLSSDLEGRPARRLPLRELLMWLQLLAVAGLALATAGPFLPAGERTHWIVVLDRSATMVASGGGEASRLELARAAVLARLEAAGADDTLTLILAGARPEIAGSWSREQLPAAGEALRATRAFLGGSNLLAALALASSLAGVTSDSRPVIVLVSGGAFEPIDAAQLGRIPGDVVMETVGQRLENVYIASLSTRAQANARTRTSALVRIGNDGDTRQTRTLRVSADGIALGSRSVAVNAGGTLEAVFPLPVGSSVVEAHLEPTDAYIPDDHAFAIAPATRLLEVRVVSANPVFWERLLTGVRGVRVTRVRPNQYRPAEAALHVFDNYLPGDVYMPATPLLIVNPPPLRGSESGRGLLRSARVPSPAGVTHVDAASPLVRSADLIGLVVSSGGLLEIPAWAKVDVQTRAGPVVLSGDRAGRRTVLLAVDPGKSGFDRDVAFPVLISNAIDWLTDPDASTEAEIGAPRTYAPAPGSRDVILRLPSGRAVSYPNRGQPIVIGDVLEPGVYTLVERSAAGVTSTEAFVANLPATERGHVNGRAEPESLLTGLTTDPRPGQTGAADLLWVYLAAVALAVSLLEWLLYSLELR